MYLKSSFINNGTGNSTTFMPINEGAMMTTKKRALSKSEPTSFVESQRSGRWSQDEKLLFLHGVMVYGKGRWKKIRTFLPARSLTQIKSHAQKVMKRGRGGDDIFALLRDNRSRIEALVHDKAGSMRITPHLTSHSSIGGDYEDNINSSLTVHAPMQLLSDCNTQDDRFRFNIGYGHERTDHESSVYRATLGGPCVKAFTFPPLRATQNRYPDDESETIIGSVSTFSTVSITSTSEDDDVKACATAACITPQRKNTKGVDAMAAEALCGLLGLAAPAARKRKAMYTPYLVSP